MSCTFKNVLQSPETFVPTQEGWYGPLMSFHNVLLYKITDPKISYCDLIFNPLCYHHRLQSYLCILPVKVNISQVEESDGGPFLPFTWLANFGLRSFLSNTGCILRPCLKARTHWLSISSTFRCPAKVSYNSPQVLQYGEVPGCHAITTGCLADVKLLADFMWIQLSVSDDIHELQWRAQWVASWANIQVSKLNMRETCSYRSPWGYYFLATVSRWPH